MLQVLILIVALICAGTASAGTRVYFEAEGWAYAEPVPITAYADDWNAGLDRGADGYAWLQAESGVRHNDWILGWVLQRQYVVEANRDAARLYHLTRNEETPLPNQRYDVDLSINYYEARGFRIGRALAPMAAGDWKLQLEPSLVAWDGTAFDDGQLRGSAFTDSNGELSYTASLRHAYTEDALLDRRVVRPEGRGASLDLSGTFSWGEKWSGDFRLRNLLGRMWWKSAPYTTGQLSSETRQTDESGLVRFAPTLSGFEGKASYRQRMPLFANLSLRRSLGSNRIGVNIVHTEVGTFPGIGWDQRRGQMQYGLEWLPSARNAVEASIAWGILRLRVGGNAWRWDDAEQLHLQLSLEIPLHRFWKSAEQE